MNFIILNGRKSTEVAGLMIQSLPPVVKPPMRVQLDEVDGRDGDIITPLGFSGYDRTVKIGLRGVYDEDDIVQYFNSSGKVIFSNEPDKVYDYTIVESFSLDRLRRFREADVVFHVQPFKHSVVAEKIVAATVEYENAADPVLPFTGGPQLSYSNGVFTYDQHISLDEGLPFYHWQFYSIKKPFYIYPGVAYTGKLIITGGSITNGTLNVGLRYGTSELFADQVLTSSSSGTINLTITATSQGFVDRIAFKETATQVSGDVYAVNINNLTFTLEIYSYPTAEFEVVNRGNIYAMPVFTFTNARNFSISVNGGAEVNCAAGDTENIVLDTEQMRAYSGNTLKNRRFTGNYANLRLGAGKNTIKIDGMFDNVAVSNYSRWI